MPYRFKRIFARLTASACLLAAATFVGAAPAPSLQADLAWRAPLHGVRWTASSTVNENVTYQMSSMLRAMAGHRADPVVIVEDRTRTFQAGSANAVAVDDVYARRHGGPDTADTTVKRRTRKQIVPADAGGRYSIEPYLCKGEPALDDANSDPKTYTTCPAQDPNQWQYEDPGDAALAEFPLGPIKVGSTWTFTRPVVVGREFASGDMTFVDTLVRLTQAGNDRVATIDVAATGRIDLPKDLQARGFHTGTMALSGSADFDLDSGWPQSQHYSGHCEWHTSIMGMNLGLTFDETYDGKAWVAAKSS